ncbi:MAG: FAD-dependent oxidoreductase [Microbacterium sp.]|nr:FAD-dependent oxidoreductase [Microbacterium sp.]
MDAMSHTAAASPEPEAIGRVRRTQVAVIGGGIAGLVAALEWARIGASVTVIEQRARLGGAIETRELDGLPVDLVADTLPLGDAGVAALLDELGLRDAIEASAAHPVWVAGLPGTPGAAPLPSGAIVGVPANPWADDVRRVIGWSGAWRAYLDRLRPPLTIGHERSLGRLVRTRMGARVVDRLVAPVTRGLYGVEPDDIDVDAAAPGLSAALTRVGSLAGAVAAQLPDAVPTGEPGVEAASRGASRGTLRGGLVLLVAALTRRLSELDANVVTGATVTEITRRDGVWHLAVASDSPAVDEADRPDHPDEPGASRVADVVVLATGGAAASTLLTSAGITIAAGSAPAARSREVVTLVVEAPVLDAAPRGRAVYPVARAAGDGSETGAVASAVVHATADWPWLAAAAGPGRHVLRVTLDGPPPASDEAAVALATRVAGDLLGAPLPAPRAAAVARVAAPLPASSIGHAERTARVRASVAGAPGLAVVGSWVAGGGIGQVVGDAIAEIDRQRRAVLWSDGEN